MVTCGSIEIARWTCVSVPPMPCRKTPFDFWQRIFEQAVHNLLNGRHEDGRIAFRVAS